MTISNIVSIDKFALDEEFENQSVKFLEAAEVAADCLEERDLVKFDLEQVEAEVSMDIRKDPKKYSLEKITESSVKEALVLTKKYKEATIKLIEANNKVKKADAIREAYDQRKRSMEKLADLWIAGYWSTPKQRVVSEIRRNIEGETREVIIDILNKGKQHAT
jgi:hypothetical protein